MRALIPVLLLLLVAGTAAAQGTLEFDGWLYSDESVTIDKRLFLVTIQPGGIEVIMQIDRDFGIIGLGDCETTESMRICYADSDRDLDTGDRRARLKIYSLSPELEIARSVGGGTLVVDQEYEVSVNLSNTGEATARSVAYEDGFPDSIEIADCDRCTADGGTVAWTGSLKAGETHEMTYTIVPREPVDQDLRAMATYSDGETTMTEYSSTLTFEARPAILAEYGINATEIDAGGSVRIDINLTNVGERDATVGELALLVPDGLKLLGQSSAFEAVGSSKLVWSGDLRAGTTRRLYAEFSATVVGSSDLIIEGSYIVGNRKRSIVGRIGTVEAEARGLMLHSTFDNDLTLESGQLQQVAVNLQNLDDIGYRDVRVTFDTTLADISPIYLASIGAGEYRRLARFDVAMPAVNATRVYDVAMNLTYETLYGELYTDGTEASVTVEPIRGIGILHSISPATAESGEEVGVEVRLTNNRRQDVSTVSAEDVFSRDLYLEGVSEKVIRMLPDGQEVTAYAYTITAPDVGERMKVNITTLVSYTENGTEYRFNRTSSFLVEPKDLALDIVRTPDVTTVFAGQLVTVDYLLTNNEEESLFGIVITYPKDRLLDSVGAAGYAVSRIDPGESLRFDNIQMVRPKAAGTVRIGKSALSFTDALGHAYRVNASEDALSVASGFIQGPALLLTRNVSVAGRTVAIGLAVENVGSEPVSAQVSDLGESWSVSLGRGQEKRFAYNHTPSSWGNLTLPPAQAAYTYFNRTFYAYSGEDRVGIAAPAAPATEPAAGILPDREEGGEGQEETLLPPEGDERTIAPAQDMRAPPQEERKNPLSTIIEFIKKLIFGED
ncbi:hypothetical protein JXB02_02035 [Candidatus Woesearchaeota archaeon]|nr:hypothetical protein [Candidatus Woesearchaeota archaeon]